MAVCKKCGTDDRYKGRACKACHKVARTAYYQANREKKLAKNKEWVEKNRDRVNALAYARRGKNPEKSKVSSAKYYVNNKQKRNEYSSAWRKSHPEVMNAHCAKRNAARLNATPLWANDFFIKEIYHLSQLRTKLTGIRWHVDHIVPLNSKLVCGLHTEANLQVIPASLNMAKHNCFWPDMP